MQDLIEKQEPESPLEMLYEQYTQQHPIDSDVMQRYFRELDTYMAPLPRDAQNAIVLTACRLYAENERLAFFSGAKMGVRLARELAD